MNALDLFLKATARADALALALRTIAPANNSLKVDREAGIVRGIAVISLGTTKESGGGLAPFDVDSVTLSQVADIINSSANGIKSRITHPEFTGSDGLSEMVGKVRNARVENGRVLGDFYAGSYAAHSPKGNLREFIFGLAEDAPTDAGLSIVSGNNFSLLQSTTPTGRVLRVSAISAVDWVGDPAANPNGMLSAKNENTNDGASPSDKESTMKFHPAMIAYMETLGLPKGATPEAAQAFHDSMTPDQQAQCDAMLGAATPAPVTPALSASSIEAIAAAIEKRSLALAAKVEADKKVADAAKVSANDGQLLLAAERTRVKEIRDLATLSGLGDTWAAEHIVNGTATADVRGLALKAKADGWQPVPQSGSSADVKVGDNRNFTTIRAAVSDALMLAAGVPLAEYDASGGLVLSENRQPKARAPHARTNEFRGHRTLEIGRRYLVALGCREADRMTKPELATLLLSRRRLSAALPSGLFLAQSTGDFPYILGDVMGKSMRNAYQTAESTWRLWARAVTAPDFKSQKLTQLSSAADLASMLPGDEYTYGSLSESRETWTLAKYGKGLEFTREMLINDDMNAFDRAPALIGAAAKRLEDVTTYAVLSANANLADGGALFNATATTTAGGHANYTTGVNAISVATLGVGRAAIRRQTALGSTDPLNLVPKFLLVPAALENLADQYTSNAFVSAQSSNINPFAQGGRTSLTPIVEARLDSVATYGLVTWYLLCDSSQIDTVHVGFLEGEEAPTIEEEQEFSNDTLRMKVRHYVAAKAIDYRGMYKSLGA